MRTLTIRTLMYFITTCAYWHMSTLTAFAQTNAPSSATQVPAATLTPAFIPAGYSGINDFNYVRSWTPQQPYQDIKDVMSSDRTPAQVLQSTQYFDGMSRPIQSVTKQIGPDASGKQDAVNMATYDAFGRVAQQYLPYMSATNDGKIKTDPFKEQNTFYTTTYPTDQPSLTGEKFFYSQTNYEASPLNKVTSTAAPGNSWAGSNRTSAQQFSINLVSDSVVIWKIACEESIGDDKNLPYTAGRYDETTLYKNIITDEQGRKKISYTNKSGQTILTKTQQADSPTTGHSGWLCTYYIYDDLGRLRCIIQPQAVQYMNTHTWDITSTLLTEQCFRYEYDGRKRTIAKKIPGAAWLYMIYDKRDRIVFTQDANLRSKNQWTTILYDAQNRPTTTGITTYTGTRAQLIDYVNNLSDNSTSLNISGSSPSTTSQNLIVSERQAGRTTYQATEQVELSGEFTSESTAEFTAEIIVPTATNFTNSIAIFNNPVPTVGTFVPLTINYYDDYSFTTNTYDNSNNSKLDAGTNAYADALPSAASNNTYQKPTGTKIRVIEDANDITKGPWLTTVYYYDDKNRSIQIQTENFKGGKDIATARYNFVGAVVCSYTVHNNPAAAITNLTTQTNYNYDHAGRLLNISKKINDDNNTKRTLVEYTYDKMGQAKTKRLGQKRNADGTLSTQPLDILEYDYNIRGWLTGINANFTKTATDNSKYFGMQLSYDWGFQNSLYNGNIAGTQWKTKGSGAKRAYGLGYDNTNQLLFADFNQYENSTWDKAGKGGALNFSTLIGDGKNANTAYDANGNIQVLKQWGAKIGNGQLIMDNLQYSYNASGLSNQLNAVTEDNTIASTDNKLGDFTDGNRTGTDYDYDANGNVLADKNKNITAITYNYLDLPTTITVKDKGTINYIYDAAGNKLEKKVEALNGGKVTITTYLSGAQYVNNTLKQIAHEQGRIRPNPLPLGGLGWAFDYFETDHLGNTRIVLTDEWQKDQYPIATMEEGNADIEKMFYTSIDNTRADRPSGFTDATTNPNNKVAKLRGDGNKIGPGIILKVMAGDKINTQVNSWYDAGGASPAGNNSLVDELISVLTNNIPTTSAGKLGSGTVSSTVLQNPISTFSDLVGNSTNTTTTKPKAHLNYVLLDEAQLSYVSEGSGCKQVGDDKTITKLNSSIDVSRNGYLYIYTSNETSNIDVFFDNLQLTHTRSPLLEEYAYYPFGGEMKGIGSKAMKGLAYINNNYKFNAGSELNEDLDINVYETPYRNYNAQIGRFQGIDQLAELTPSLTPNHFGANNPISFNDPTGLALAGVSDNWAASNAKEFKRLNAETDAIARGGGGSGGGSGGGYYGGGGGGSGSSAGPDDWVRGKNGNIYYDPTVQKPGDVTNGGTYLGDTYMEKSKLGTINYRIDGSILFSNQTDAFNRMYNTSKLNSNREEMGVIMNDRVLVLPDYKNTSGDSKAEYYGYSWRNGNLIDGVTHKELSTLSTMHTHLSKSNGDPDPSYITRDGYGDVGYFGQKTPYKPFFTMGWDGEVYGYYSFYKNGENIPTARGPIGKYFKPKGLMITDLLKGYNLIGTLQTLKFK